MGVGDCVEETGLFKRVDTQFPTGAGGGGGGAGRDFACLRS